MITAALMSATINAGRGFATNAAKPVFGALGATVLELEEDPADALITVSTTSLPLLPA